jgi:hypothetical protein
MYSCTADDKISDSHAGEILNRHKLPEKGCKAREYRHPVDLQNANIAQILAPSAANPVVHPAIASEGCMESHASVWEVRIPFRSVSWDMVHTHIAHLVTLLHM